MSSDSYDNATDRSKGQQFADLVDELLFGEPKYDQTKAVCKECDEVFVVETPQHGMIEHCGRHPPLSELVS